jgi:hypothetical protein
MLLSTTADDRPTFHRLIERLESIDPMTWESRAGKRGADHGKTKTVQRPLFDAEAK